MCQVKSEDLLGSATSDEVRIISLFPLPKHARQLPLDLFSGILSTMNTLESISELARAVRDLIRIGVIVDVQYAPPRCRVQLGGNHRAHHYEARPCGAGIAAPKQLRSAKHVDVTERRSPGNPGLFFEVWSMRGHA